MVGNFIRGSSPEHRFSDRQLGLSYFTFCVVLGVMFAGFVAILRLPNLNPPPATSGKAQAPASVSEADSKLAPAEAAPHVCDGCVGALKAVEYLTSQLRSRYDLVPSEQALTPLEYEQARAYLASATVRDLPPGWEPAIVVKKRSEGGGNDLAIAIADGSFRALQAGASSEGPVPGNQLRHELDSHQMATLLDLGDHLILNPAAFGRSRESPQWVFKTGEWRIIKKFAIPTQ